MRCQKFWLSVYARMQSGRELLAPTAARNLCADPHRVTLFAGLISTAASRRGANRDRCIWKTFYRRCGRFLALLQPGAFRRVCAGCNCPRTPYRRRHRAKAGRYRPRHARQEFFCARGAGGVGAAFSPEPAKSIFRLLDPERSLSQSDRLWTLNTPRLLRCIHHARCTLRATQSGGRPARSFLLDAARCSHRPRICRCVRGRRRDIAIPLPGLLRGVGRCGVNAKSLNARHALRRAGRTVQHLVLV